MRKGDIPLGDFVLDFEDTFLSVISDCRDSNDSSDSSYSSDSNYSSDSSDSTWEYQMVTRTYLLTYLWDSSDLSDSCDSCDSSDSSDSSDRSDKNILSLFFIELRIVTKL